MEYKSTEEQRAKDKEYYQKNKAKKAEYSKEYRATRQEKNKSYQKEYYQKNKKRINEYKKNFFKNNPKKKMTQKQRIQISKEIKKGINFMISTIKHLDCTFSQYSVYLESKFDENMSWENYGEYWEIDHIIPLNKGGSFHYTNTQPLSVEENRKKGDSLV
jgi:5-methylcytosine-specific restriction endonuclease McrA